MTKKIIILYHDGGELANQLWNYISVFAYTKENGLELENYSFYEYGYFFCIPVKNKFANFFLFKAFSGNTKRKFSLTKKIYRKLYRLYVNWVRIFKKDLIITSTNLNNEPYYLPPTNNMEPELFRLRDKDIIYFDGWLFRNPKGIEKFRTEIREYFRPKECIEYKVDKFIKNLRKKFSHIVGVHIRQGDYINWKNGIYYIDPSRFKEIMLEYLQNKDIHNTCFVITSDGKVPEDLFKEFNFVVSKHNMVEDMFILSKTDTIIGTNSSFGNIAAYFGNIPHIIATYKPIDWQYYEKRNNYFENKYCTLVHY